MSSNNRKARLGQIYRDIERWAQDRSSVPRNVAAIDPAAKLTIVGEAIGPKTLRLSGVPFFNPRGKLGQTGTNLERLVSQLGFTLYPSRDVRLPKAILKSAAEATKKPVYCTDICPVFPGYARTREGRRSIRRPSSTLIRSALEKRFLERELDIVKPRVILLLGTHAYRHFHRHFMGKEPPKLSSLLRGIKNCKFPIYKGAVVIPCFHPSPGNPTFTRWATSRAYLRFVERVQNCLRRRVPESQRNRLRNL